DRRPAGFGAQRRGADRRRPRQGWRTPLRHRAVLESRDRYPLPLPIGRPVRSASPSYRMGHTRTSSTQSSSGAQPAGHGTTAGRAGGRASSRNGRGGPPLRRSSVAAHFAAIHTAVVLVGIGNGQQPLGREAEEG